MINDEFKKYPIRVDFFINRRLFSSQYRSPELDGALGVDIGPDIATPPFNYEIVATLLHPNRQYLTVFQNALFSSDLSGTLDCTLITNATSDTEFVEFTAQDVSFAQGGNNSFNVSFSGENAAQDKTASFSGSVTVTEETGTSSATIVQDDVTSSVTLSGDVAKGDAGVSSVSLVSSDGNVELNCE